MLRGRYAHNTPRLPRGHRRARRGIGERLPRLVHWRVRASSSRATRRRIRDPRRLRHHHGQGRRRHPCRRRPCPQRRDRWRRALHRGTGRRDDRRPGHDRDAGIHRDAFALLERAAEEHAPARRRLFSVEGGVWQAPHADRLLPGRAAVHDRRAECRHHHGHQLRAQYAVAGPCRRGDPTP